MNCHFNKNATLSSQQHFANTHTRSSSVDFPSGPLVKGEKLQTVAIFLHFWSSIVAKRQHTRIYRARVFCVFGNYFRKIDGETRKDKRKKSLSVQINGNWSHFELKIELY